jgi:hypothetical protein
MAAGKTGPERHALERTDPLVLTDGDGADVVGAQRVRHDLARGPLGLTA